MKILFYSPVSLLSGGGCERWHCDVTNALKNIGHDVKVVTGNLSEGTKWSEEYLKEQIGDIKVRTLGYKRFLGILIPTPKVVIYLYKSFKQSDYIHFIYGFMGQDILIAILKLLTRKKVIVGHHAPIFHVGKVHNFYMKYISRHIMKVFNAHITLNSRDKEFFEKRWGIKNVYFIPSGVKVERFLDIKRELHDKLSFISIGRLENQKGVDLLLKAVEKFNETNNNNNAKFILVGDGSQRGLVEKNLDKLPNVDYRGFVEYEKIAEVYKESDIFLLSSREEPFGLVLIEAWASGIPVLATKTEGPSDMINEGVNGWFIENVNENSIFEGINKIYNDWLLDKNRYLLMEQECKKTGMEYSINSMANKMLDIYEQI